MDYHFDSTIVLSEEIEHKNLYKWCLREVHDPEVQYRRDQIPWQWTQYFTLSQLKLRRSIRLGERYASGDETQPPQVEVRDVISAKIVPTNIRDSSLSSTQYSMFRTNRTITEFELSVYEGDEGGIESCSAWGAVSYTMDVDFHDVTAGDALTFYLTVTPVRFARILNMVADKLSAAPL